MFCVNIRRESLSSIHKRLWFYGFMFCLRSRFPGARAHSGVFPGRACALQQGSYKYCACWEGRPPARHRPPTRRECAPGSGGQVCSRQGWGWRGGGGLAHLPYRPSLAAVRWEVQTPVLVREHTRVGCVSHSVSHKRRVLSPGQVTDTQLTEDGTEPCLTRTPCTVQLVLLKVPCVESRFEDEKELLVSLKISPSLN